MTKQGIIRRLAFYGSVLSTIWETKAFTEADYYLKFNEIQKKKAEREVDYYGNMHELLGLETEDEKAEETKSFVLAFSHFCKDFIDQLDAGEVDSLEFAHRLKSKITFTKQQRKELGKLIKKLENQLKDLDQSESSTGLSSETDYEVIYQPQAHEKDRESLQNTLNELENKLGSLFEQKWTSCDFKEEEFTEEENEEYLLIEPVKKEELVSDSSDYQDATQQAQILQQEDYTIPGSWPGKNV